MSSEAMTWGGLIRVLAGVALIVPMIGCATPGEKSKFVGDRLVFSVDPVPFEACEAVKTAGARMVSESFEGENLRYYLFEDGGRPWILHVHGNSESACDRIDFGKELAGKGFNVMMAEYPGFAGDETEATPKIVSANLLAMGKRARQKAGGRSLVIIGDSLGTAPATFIASEMEVEGLALAAPYRSIGHMVHSNLATAVDALLLFYRQFPAFRWAPKVKCPVLATASRADKRIPVGESMNQAQLFDDCRLVMMDGASHMEIATWKKKRMLEALDVFLGQVAPR